MLKDDGKQLNKNGIDLKAFAERLITLRKDNHLSRKDLYRAMDEITRSVDYPDDVISYQNALNNGAKNVIWNYENGRSLPTVAKLNKLANIFKVTPFYLLCGDTREYTIKVIENIKFVSTMDFYQKGGIAYGHSYEELSDNNKLFVKLDNLFSYIVDNYKPRFDFDKQSTMNNIAFDMDETPKKDHANWRLAVIEFAETDDLFERLVKKLNFGLKRFDFSNGMDILDYFKIGLLSSIDELFDVPEYQNQNYRPIYKRLDYLINKTEYNVQLDLPSYGAGNFESENISNLFLEMEAETQAYFKKLDKIKARYREAISEKDNS